MKIGIIGLGFVGGSMYKSFEYKGLIPNDNLFGYDKFCLELGTGKLEDMYKCDILFLALPTTFNTLPPLVKNLPKLFFLVPA